MSSSLSYKQYLLDIQSKNEMIYDKEVLLQEFLKYRDSKKTKSNLKRISELKHLLCSLYYKMIIKLIIPYAISYKNLDDEDFISAGIIGFYQSLETYNPEFNTQLSTHSYRYIQNGIEEVIRNHLGIKRSTYILLQRVKKDIREAGGLKEIKVPLKDWLLEKDYFTGELQVRSFLEYTSSILEAYETGGTAIVSLDTLFDNNGESLANDESMIIDSPDKIISKKTQYEEIVNLITKKYKLSKPRDYYLLGLRFGFLTLGEIKNLPYKFKGDIRKKFNVLNSMLKDVVNIDEDESPNIRCSLEETGTLLGITRERVRQIEALLIKHLRLVIDEYVV